MAGNATTVRPTRNSLPPACRRCLASTAVATSSAAAHAAVTWAETRLTRDGIAIGTRGYAAPEQEGGREVDVRADIYALGCVAFWLLTERAVFEGETAMKVLRDQNEVVDPVIDAGQHPEQFPRSRQIDRCFVANVLGRIVQGKGNSLCRLPGPDGRTRKN